MGLPQVAGLDDGINSKPVAQGELPLMNPMQIVLADKHASVRQMVEMVLIQEGPYKVIGEAATGEDTLQICRDSLPDLLILDLALDGLPALEVIRSVRREYRKMRLLIFSGISCREVTLEALRMQPHGFVHKEESLITFRAAVRAVLFGHGFLTQYATRLTDELELEGGAPRRLSLREQVILQMVANGKTSKEMAACLAVSPKTVEHHRARLMAKLNLHDVAGLTRYALSAGMVEQ